MSTSVKKKKVNKKTTNKKLNAKVILLIALAFIFLTVSIIIILDRVEKSKYYECTEYVFVTKTNTDPINDNYLKDFVYYRIYLHDDNTFTLKYKKSTQTAGKINQEVSYTGTYTKTEKRLTLTYTDFPEEQNGEDDQKGVVKYDIIDGKLIREEFVIIGETRMTIKQTFKK